MFGQGMPFHTIQEQLILQNKLLAALIGVVAAPRSKLDGSAVIGAELADKIREISDQMKQMRG